MKIIVADAATLGADLDLSPLSLLGEVEIYAATPRSERGERSRSAPSVAASATMIFID